MTGPGFDTTRWFSAQTPTRKARSIWPSIARACIGDFAVLCIPTYLAHCRWTSIFAAGQAMCKTALPEKRLSF